MKRTYARILITLRDGGTLTTWGNASNGDLLRADRSPVAAVRWRTIQELHTIWGYLQKSTLSTRVRADWVLTEDGQRIARSIRNTVTP